VWTTSWTDYNTGVSGKTKMSDVAPESGYTGAEFTSLDTAVYMSMSWMTGSRTTGSASEWAVAPRNTNNSMVCNGGANLY
jgi:hypothetical protein